MPNALAQRWVGACRHNVWAEDVAFSPGHRLAPAGPTASILARVMVSPCHSAVYRAEANRPLLDLLPGGARTILDVGCGTGENARALREIAQHVVGITMSAAEAHEARQWCTRVLVADVERDAMDLQPKSFDVLLLSHVLEHLTRPTETLAKLAEYLVPGGWAAIAVPNMAFWRVRVRLLRGDWRREAGGWLDRTHLQFWSFDTAPELLSGTPLALERREGASFAVPMWPLRRLAPVLSRRLDLIVGQMAPRLFAGQVLLLARKGGDGRLAKVP